MGQVVVLTVPDYTNAALASPNVANSIADILLDVLKPYIAGQAVPKVAQDENNQTDTYEDVINITDVGRLTGISASVKNSTDASDFGTILITIDGTPLSTILVPTITFICLDGAATAVNYSFGFLPLSFNHPFATSLRVQHKVNGAGGSITTTVSYTTD